MYRGALELSAGADLSGKAPTRRRGVVGSAVGDQRRPARVGHTINSNIPTPRNTHTGRSLFLGRDGSDSPRNRVTISWLCVLVGFFVVDGAGHVEGGVESVLVVPGMDPVGYVVSCLGSGGIASVVYSFLLLAITESAHT